jgi:hypothetical protein
MEKGQNRLGENLRD